MAKRVKPALNIPTVHNLNEADAMLARIKAWERELALLELRMKEEIDALKLKCAEQAEPILEYFEIMRQALTRFGEANKAELFIKKRSITLNFGIIGFRMTPPTPKPLKKITWEQVLGILKNSEDPELVACVRTKQEVDRMALRELSPEKLAQAGCRLEQVDEFFCDTRDEALAAAEGCAQ